MTFNIGGMMSDQRRLLVLLQQQRPDLLLLQELRHVQQLQGMARRLQLPYWHFAPYAHGLGGGIGILSRWPLGAAQTLVFNAGKQGRVALATTLDAPQGLLWVCSVHLESPRLTELMPLLWRGIFLWRELFAATPRFQQARQLRTWLERLAEDAWIIGGDFNTIPFSRVDRHLSQQFGDVLLHRPWRYLTGTYWKLPFWPVKPRIDFLYHTPNIRVFEARVVRQKVSDHFPILSILAPSKPIEARQPVQDTAPQAAFTRRMTDRMPLAMRR